MGKINYIKKFKNKCNLNNEFIEIVESLFDKLIDFGYISNSNFNKFSKRLCDNIDTVIFASPDKIDYKSGYYDAIKKELYVKEISNIKSIYLHLLYAITTTKNKNEGFSVGYSNEYLSISNYKITYTNYALNRAILSNLTCRILYTLPTALSIYSDYRTYQNDFLGYKIESHNDIYFLEGKLFSQMCSVLKINEEDIYSHLFLKNPTKYFINVLNSSILEEPKINDLLTVFDRVSKTYSNLNKLNYLNNMLIQNYIERKKLILEENTDKLEEENNKIKKIINDTLIKLNSFEENSNNSNAMYDIDNEISLAEKIESLERNVLQDILTIQDILTNVIIKHREDYLPIEYAQKLKELSSLLVIKNDILYDELYNIISTKLVTSSEHTTTNITEKIKYTLIDQLILDEKFKSIQNSLTFRKIDDLQLESMGISYVTINIDNNFIELAQITRLNNPMNELEDNFKLIKLDNLKHQLNNTSLHEEALQIETLFTQIIHNFEEFKFVQLENMYICNTDYTKFVIILINGDINVLKLNDTDGNLRISRCTLSEYYYVFGDSTISVMKNKKVKKANNDLPALYKHKPNFFKRFISVLILKI